MTSTSVTGRVVDAVFEAASDTTQAVRAYLAKGKYRPTGQTDNGWAVVYPNGIETLPAK